MPYCDVQARLRTSEQDERSLRSERAGRHALTWDGRRLGGTVRQLLSLFLLACTCQGCERAEHGKDSDAQLFARAKEQVRRSLRHALSKPQDRFSPLVESSRRMLGILENGGIEAITVVPELYKVGVGRVEGRGGLILVVYWLERDCDVAALCVREYWPGGEAICETYELPARVRRFMAELGKLGWAHTMCWRVTERTCLTSRKDPELWRVYSASDKVPSDGQPPLYIARPSDKVHVLISLVDSVGHESRVMPLQAWYDERTQGDSKAVRE